jgi:hypothetical protein
MLSGMTTCSYCDQPATMTIIANPPHVCAAHAREFWTGLLLYTHSRSALCVKADQVCSCPLCEEMARAVAIRSVGPSPGDHEQFTIRLAS